jgi:hypothetical protein
MRYARADLAIYFRPNRFLCLWRLLKRRLRPDTEIEDLPQGCSKRVPWRLISYMWGFDRHIREPLAQLQARYPDVQYVQVRSDRAVKKLLHI